MARRTPAQIAADTRAELERQREEINKQLREIRAAERLALEEELMNAKTALIESICEKTGANTVETIEIIGEILLSDGVMNRMADAVPKDEVEVEADEETKTEELVVEEEEEETETATEPVVEETYSAPTSSDQHQVEDDDARAELRRLQSGF